MPEMIRDGTGSGSLARVNSDNQLVTRAIGVEQRLKSTLDFNYFEATTGQVTLTDAVETGIIYLKNLITDGRVLVIDRVFCDIWTSTNGSGADGTLKYYLNPTITGGTIITPNNTNFGSTIAATGTFLKSTTTISGNAWWTGYSTDKTSVIFEEGRIVVPSGSSFAISCAAPTGNTSMKISINVAFYYFDKNLVGD